jgi:hypothetical protein
MGFLRREWVFAATLVAVALTSYAGFSNGTLPRPVMQVAWDRTAGSYIPARTAPGGGTEVVLAYVTAPSCGWCNPAWLPPLIEAAKTSTRAVADQAEYRFATLGVSQSSSAELGIRHLRRFGQFDEVAAGRGWVNTSLQKYVYTEFPGVAATPQIVVLRRNVQQSESELTIAAEEVIGRYVGVHEIRRWVEAGTPLDRIAGPWSAP